MGMKRIVRNTGLVLVILAISLVSGHHVHAKTIGVIMTGDVEFYNDIHKAFIDKIKEVVTTEKIDIIIQKPMPNSMAWINSARKLVAIGSDFIISYGSPTTLMAMREASGIPVLFAGVYSPESLNITGKNATGISSTVSIESTIHYLDGIRKISTLGVLFSKSEKDTILQAKEIKQLENKLGFKTVLIDVKNIVNRSKTKSVDAFLMTTSSACFRAIGDIVDIARQDNKATASLMGGCSDKGVILTVSPNPVEQGTELAKILKMVLGGSKPSDIPFKRPRQIDVVVNLKEAKALKLDIPAKMLGRATRVIE